MKKNILFLILILIMSCSINQVNASVTCDYGEGEGDDWVKKFQFDISDDGTYSLNTNSKASPHDLISTHDKWQLEETGKSYGYVYAPGDTNAGEWTHNVYYNLFPNVEKDNIKEKAKNGDTNLCPRAITYKSCSTHVGSLAYTTFNYYFYLSDDMGSRTLSEVWDCQTNIDSVVLRVEGAKEMTDAEIDDTCETYRLKFDDLKATKADGDGDGQQDENPSCDNNARFSEAYQDLANLCESFRSTSSYATEDGEQSRSKACSKACSLLKDQVVDLCGADSEFTQCGSLGNKVIKWIFKIVNFVRYSVPVLLIILSILDYIKALASDSDDEMKKVTGRFVKRLIAAALIFIVPFILEFLLRMFTIPGLNSDNMFCAN